MKYSILIFLIYSTTAFAEVPTWLKAATKNVALDQFVEWMVAPSLYRISKVETTEIKLESGQEGAKVQFIFDDEKGCKNRTHVVDCVAQGEGLMFCQKAMTDCHDGTLEVGSTFHETIRVK